MERQLNLVGNLKKSQEKRQLPRFPLCYLTFKLDGAEHVFEVKNISYSGMQLTNPEKNVSSFKVGDNLKGTISWHGRKDQLKGSVKWIKDANMGIAFENASKDKIENFLSLEQIANNLRPAHLYQKSVTIPADLSYWVRSDGPVDVCVWKYAHNEAYQKFQVVLMDTIVEWVDGIGVRTGQVFTKRNLETPLFDEDEIVIEFDNRVDQSKLSLIKKFVSCFPEKLKENSEYQFMQQRL